MASESLAFSINQQTLFFRALIKMYEDNCIKIDCQCKRHHASIGFKIDASNKSTHGDSGMPEPSQSTQVSLFLLRPSSFLFCPYQGHFEE